MASAAESAGRAQPVALQVGSAPTTAMHTITNAFHHLM